MMLPVSFPMTVRRPLKARSSSSSSTRLPSSSLPSLVSRITLRGTGLLQAGDISGAYEGYSAVPADILKMSHHGSQTGTAAELLNAVQPRLAVISCGAYSIYHNPDYRVLKRLENAHVPYLLTREEGDISIFFLPRMNLLVTAQGKIDIIFT